MMNKNQIKFDEREAREVFDAATSLLEGVAGVRANFANTQPMPPAQRAFLLERVALLRAAAQNAHRALVEEG